MDIVGYSTLTQNDDQRDAITKMNELVQNALAVNACRQDNVVCLPAGDAIGLGFISVADAPLLVAEAIQTGLARQSSNGPKLQFRMGIDCGTAYRLRDMKGSYTLAGAAINMAQRTMSCGDANHILCTDKAFEEFAKMKDYRRFLRPIKKPFRVKHGVILKLYNYVRPDRGVGNPSLPKR